MAKITDPDLLNQGTEVVIDTTLKTIQLVVAGNLSNDGVALQTVYSFIKEEWRLDPSLIRFKIPMEAITSEQFELINGWDFSDQTSKNLIRDGGWALKAGGGVSEEEYMNLTSLGSFDDSGSDQAYYLQVEGGVPTDIVLTGEVNQAIKIYGDVSHGSVDYRTYFKIYLREVGKLYGFSDLIDEQNLTTLTYKKYALPLSNATDLKISVTDVEIDGNADGDADITPYDNMNIVYLEGSGFSAWVNSTVYIANTVVSNGGRWYITTAGGTSNGTGVGDDVGVTWVAYDGERDIGGTYYAYNTIVDANVSTSGNNPSAEQIYEFIQWSLRQTVNIDSGVGVVRGDTGDELLEFVGDTLLTKIGVYVDDYNATDTNRIEFTDVSDLVRTFPFVAAGKILFNGNLVNDASAKYWVFFTDANGSNFGDVDAIIIEDNTSLPINGDISAQAEIQFDFDYDGNVQGGRTSATDADYTAVAIGLTTGQYVITTGTLSRTTENVINFVAALERNYSNL